jgi:hypothetical protein
VQHEVRGNEKERKSDKKNLIKRGNRLFNLGQQGVSLLLQHGRRSRRLGRLHVGRRNFGQPRRVRHLSLPLRRRQRAFVRHFVFFLISRRNVGRRRLLLLGRLFFLLLLGGVLLRFCFVFVIAATLYHKTIINKNRENGTCENIL